MKKRKQNTKKRFERAVVVCFTAKREKFSSLSERNRFYWGLYGRKQIIVKKSKKYEYKREGLLNEIPHIKVDNSVFIVTEKYLKKIIGYFREWEEKVEVKFFPVMLRETKPKALVEIEIEEG